MLSTDTYVLIGVLLLIWYFYWDQLVSLIYKVDPEYSNQLNSTTQQNKMDAKNNAVGFGSIWNNNSWFYEEKNFTKFAKDFLTAEMAKCVVEKDGI
jgi:uncharacterized membrane protein SpoIIM required for sporulation